MAFCCIYTVFPSQEAAKASLTVLFEKRLIACANIFPGVTSWFTWEGKLQKSDEVAVLCKTIEPRVAEALETLRSTHPYECPCLLVMKPASAWPPFAAWAEEACSPA